MACPHHAPELACLECQDGDTTDGAAFPHPGNCKGRTPVRRCEYCTRFVTREEWRRDDGVHRQGCETCVPGGKSPGPFPRKAKPPAVPVEDRE